MKQINIRFKQLLAIIISSILVLCINNSQIQAVEAQIYEYVEELGGTAPDPGEGDGEFNSPYGVAVDAEGNIYVAEYYNHRIQKFNQTGEFQAKWGFYGDTLGLFMYPYGIAVDPNGEGNLYVTDSETSRYQEFNLSGEAIAQWGEDGTGDGQFAMTRGIAVANGYVYVLDLNNARVQKFNLKGEFIKAWGSNGSENGQFSEPHGIAVDNAGNVYVADSLNERIQKFDSEGVFLLSWGVEGNENGQFRFPAGIAVDVKGYIYVTDNKNNRIQKFDSSGQYLTQWGMAGSKKGQFAAPNGIAVNESGYVYVADTLNNRVQIFRPTGLVTISMASYDLVTLYPTGTIMGGDVQYLNAAEVIAALPSSINVKLDDATYRNIPVVWIDTDTYNCEVAGFYTFTASWGALPADVDNDNSLTAPIVVIELVYGIDEQPPVWPAQSVFDKTGITQTEATLTWTPAVDNAGVTGYAIYKNTVKIADVEPYETSYSVTGLSANTSYTFEIKAKDAAGNWSVAKQVIFTTLAATTLPDGTFAEAMSLPVPSGSSGMSLGTHHVTDVDGDGLLDVWIVGIHKNAQGLFFYKGQGDGTFDLVRRFDGYNLVSKKTWMWDLTNDQRADLVEMKDNDNDGGYDETITYKGNGTGNFERLWSNRDGIATPATGGIASPVIVFADLNNDGYDDMISSVQSGISIRLNGGDGKFNLGGAFYATGGTPDWIHLGDQNGDGYTDIVVVKQSSSYPVANGVSFTVLLNNGSGIFTSTPIVKPWGNELKSVRPSILEDFNGDGRKDLLIGDYYGTASLFLCNAEGGFASAFINTGISKDIKAVTDQTGDGLADLLTVETLQRNGVSTDVIGLWANNGNGTFTFEKEIWTTTRRILSMSVAKVNGDVLDDLIIKYTTSTSSYAGFVTGFLLGGTNNKPTDGLTFYPPKQGLVNVGEPLNYSLTFSADVSGYLLPELEWYVNGVLGGNAEVGVITAFDDYTATYLPPNANFTISTAMIEARLAGTALSDSSNIGFTRYSWNKISNSTLPAVSIKKLAWAGNGSRLYAATEKEVFVSTDAGVNWTPASGSNTEILPGAVIRDLIVDPGNPLTVYVGLQRYINIDQGIGGIYKTTDGGLTWRAANNGLPLTGVGSNPNQPYFSIYENSLIFGETIGEVRALYAGLQTGGGSGEGLYKSNDGGNNWYKVSVTGSLEMVRATAAPASGSRVVYAIARNFEWVNNGEYIVYQPLILYKSTDGGANWTNLQPNIAAGFTDRQFMPSYVAVDPNNDEHVIVVGNFVNLAGYGIFESRDAGLTWIETARDFEAGGYPIAFSTVDTGVMLSSFMYISPEAERTHWYRIKAGLVTASPNVAVIAPAGAPLPGAFYAATTAGVFTCTGSKLTPAIIGVAAPVTGAIPVSTITDTTEYTATISWSPADAAFGANTVYTATITIIPKTGYTLSGVDANFFTIDGAITTNSADSGVVTAVFPSTTTDECFIATAAFGSKFDWSVELLRKFRDQYLLTNAWGTAFVKYYYQHSPPIAAAIASSQTLKTLVRLLLTPVIAGVFIIYHPVIFGFVLFLIMAVYSVSKRRLSI